MTVARYIIGYALALFLSIVAYDLVVLGSANQWLVAELLVLAIIQLVIQLAFFLHLGDEAKPRLKILSFAFMSVILVIIIVGSLWIMDNLNYNMIHMSPSEKDNYMMTQHDKGF